MGQFILTVGRMRVSQRKEETGRIIAQKLYRKGDTVEMDDEQAAPLLKSGALILPGEAPEPSPEAEEEPAAEAADAPAEPQEEAGVDDSDLSELSYADLQQEAKARGVSAGGSKDEILARISDQ